MSTGSNVLKIWRSYLKRVIQLLERLFERTDRLDRLHEQFDLGKPVAACGRIIGMRKMGKLAFAHVNDGSARFQLMVKRDVIGEEAFKAFKLLDLGDCIGVKGDFFYQNGRAYGCR